MTTDLEVETPEMECERLAEIIHRHNRDCPLLAFYREPKDGEEWRETRSKFFAEFGPDGVDEDDCVGVHLVHFYERLAGALRRECARLGIKEY